MRGGGASEVDGAVGFTRNALLFELRPLRKRGRCEQHAGRERERDLRRGPSIDAADQYRCGAAGAAGGSSPDEPANSFLPFASVTVLALHDVRRVLRAVSP